MMFLGRTALMAVLFSIGSLANAQISPYADDVEKNRLLDPIWDEFFRPSATYQDDLEILHFNLNRDSIRCNPTISELASFNGEELPVFNNIQPESLTDLKVGKLITGTILYRLLARLPYRYHAFINNDRVYIASSVHVKNAERFPKEIQTLKSNLKRASEIYNQKFAGYRYLGKPVRFVFRYQESSSKSHFRVNFKKGTRGPYLFEWNPDWNLKTVVHELGHILGMDDEYDKKVCSNRSYMCTSQRGTILKSHAYTILRRLACL